MKMQKHLNLSLIVTIFSVASCNIYCPIDDRIQCLSNFVEQHLTPKELNKIKNLHGVEFWEEWPDISESLIGQESYSFKLCNVNDFVYEYFGTGAGTPKGKYYLIFSIQSQIKYGYIDRDSIENDVENIIAHYN